MSIACLTRILLAAALMSMTSSSFGDEGLEPITYNHSGLTVDLGVGLWAWPLPLDYDRDGDMDLVVSCPDLPFNGTFFFENPGSDAPERSGTALPVFKAPVRIADARKNVQLSVVGEHPVVMTPGRIYLNFREEQYEHVIQLPLPEKIDPQYKRYRANQWKLVDWEGDGDLDVIVGIGIWDDYGWDDAWDEQGEWKNGPLHGFVYLVENVQSETEAQGAALEADSEWPDELGPRPVFAEAVKVEANGQAVDVYGMPSPSLDDYDGDGDLDFICGEFLDRFTWFENVGTRQEPKYAAGRRLGFARDGEESSHEIYMDLEMITPVAVDWDHDGDIDLICGDEDGRVALVERVAGGGPLPAGFRSPRYFQQVATDVKFGALVTPYAVDADGDGDEDVYCGNSAGYIGFIENLGGFPPRFAAPIRLTSDSEDTSKHSKVIREQAGPNGSIQGPCEAKWGYSTLSVADWNQDGGLDVMTNGIWGKVHLWESLTSPTVAGERKPVRVNWADAAPKPKWTWWTPEPGTLATQWRTTPCMIDWNEDRRLDLVMLDQEGYLALFERSTSDPRELLAPRRIFKIAGPSEFDARQRPVGDQHDGLLRLNANWAGDSGRRKLHFVDWDGDGRKDLLVNSENVNWLRNVRTDDEGYVWFEDQGPLDDLRLAGHTTSPTTVDWDQNGIPDLLVGAEDGRLYYKQNPRAAKLEVALQEPVPAESPVLKSEFIYEEAPFPACHASTIVEPPTGLVAAWFGGTREGYKDVGIWLSRQVDGKWSTPVEVANGIQHASLRYPCWNPVLFQQPEGSLHLFYKVGPSPSEWWGMQATSEDGGQNWSRPWRLPEEIIGPVKNKPLLLEDGTLICGSSTETDGWRVHFEMTRDWGLSWQRVGPINDGKEFNAIQPSLLTHADGTLQILCRSREGNVLTSQSQDGGKNWSDLTRTSLPNPNSGTDALTLRDGRQLIVYNHTKRGRSPLNIAISQDGQDWEPVLALEEDRGEYSYPAVIQTSDGMLHVTYTWKRERIRHVVLDPERL